MASYLTTYPANCQAEYTKEEFMKLMSDNGIKCSNCVYWACAPNAKYGRCTVCRIEEVVGDFFCKGFIKNTEDNG